MSLSTASRGQRSYERSELEKAGRIPPSPHFRDSTRYYVSCYPLFMKGLKRKFSGWIDKIIIYHYMSAILIKFSEIETCILSAFCQNIFTGGNNDLQNSFNAGNLENKL